MTATADQIDQIDEEILALLQEDARRTVADIALHVALSATAVKRRIERLEAAGVILGYAARIDYAKLGWGLEAFTELTFTGATTPDEMDELAGRLPEVEAVYTTAGNHDVLARPGDRRRPPAPGHRSPAGDREDPLHPDPRRPRLPRQGRLAPAAGTLSVSPGGTDIRGASAR